MPTGPAVLPAPTTLPSTEEETRLAPQWKVILLNDDVTTFEFVIWILATLFQKSLEEAVRLTYEVHETGSGLATVTNRERAELYVEQVASLARPRGYPLTATLEPA
jgi:ATP-dependent Clp protease adaptor protein ClpS